MKTKAFLLALLLSTVLSIQMRPAHAAVGVPCDAQAAADEAQTFLDQALDFAQTYANANLNNYKNWSVLGLQYFNFNSFQGGLQGQQVWNAFNRDLKAADILTSLYASLDRKNSNNLGFFQDVQVSHPDPNDPGIVMITLFAGSLFPKGVIIDPATNSIHFSNDGDDFNDTIVRTNPSTLFTETLDLKPYIVTNSFDLTPNGQNVINPKTGKPCDQTKEL